MPIDSPPILTAYLFFEEKNPLKGLPEMLNRLTEGGITIELFAPDAALPTINPKSPRVYVSIGALESQFNTLNSMPYSERRRWLHFSSPEEVQPYKLFYCWLRRTDPMPENREVPKSSFTSDQPLVSVFTAAYRCKDKIQRPYRSLLNQTYSNWEWVIVDDSGDEDETYYHYLLPLKDSRVRRYRQDSYNGYIGAIKRYAAGLCTGEILVEVDHDDDLTPDCLEKIVQTLRQHPECGFAFGEFTEVYIGSNNSHWYGWDCGFGYGVYYRVWVHEMHRWQNVLRNTVINASTIRHLVGLPNHPRAWTRDCYYSIGGHREELLVSDDYDLLVRTFLATKYAAIPDLLYIQYRNENGDNSTFSRNRQIQILVNELYSYYSERICTRVKALGLPEHVEYGYVWEMKEDDAARKSAHIINEDNSRVSMLFPIPYSHSSSDPTSCPSTASDSDSDSDSDSKSLHDTLIKAIQDGLGTNFHQKEIIVVGCVPEEVIGYASIAPMGAIRWWPMDQDDSLEKCSEYAKLCASCTKKLLFDHNL